MFDGIKLRILRKRIDSAPPRSGQLIKSDAANKILIVSDKQDSHSMLAAGKIFPQAEINILFQRKEKTDQSGLHQYAIHVSDFNLTGNLKNDKISRLLKTDFDLVLDLSANSVMLHYLLTQLRTRLLVGKMNNAKENYYDLFLDGGTSDTEFLETVKKQLNNLTSYGHTKSV